MSRQARFTITTSATALALSAGAVFFAAPTTAYAQDGARAPTEVIVTATRREQALQDVPVAVTALTTEQIENVAPRTLQDLSGVAPNLFIGMNTAAPGGGSLYIRGLGYSDVEKTQNPAAGVIIDGVFLGTNTGQLIDAFDMRQVEVTRGPAGIFFGKNTTAGVISVSRSLPTREYGFRGSISYGSENAQVYRAVANLPLGENGGVKIGGTYRDRDGYYDNLFTGNDDGGQEYTGLNAALDYDITEWFNLLAIVDVIRQEGGGSPVQFGNALTARILSGGNPSAVFGPSYNPATGSPAGLRVHQNLNNYRDADELEMNIYNVTATFDTPLGELVSVTGYIDSTDIVFQDFDGTCSGSVGCPTSAVNPLLLSSANPTATLHTIRDQDYKQLTQELRLAGSWGEAVDYLLGAYYYQHEINLRQTTNGAVFQRSGEDNDSWSIFANLDWHVIPTVTLSAGVRTIDETKDFNTRYDILVGGVPTIPLIAPITDSESWDDTITRFAANWEATESTMLYVSRSEGFRSGGFSIRGTLSERQATASNCATTGGCPGNNFLSYDPENVTAWELGAKNQFMDGRVVFNVAYFKTEIEGLQANSVVVTPGYGPGTNTYVNNLPEAEVEGYEFEITLRPGGAFEGLTLSGNVGLQDAIITDGVIDGRRTSSPTGSAGAPGSTGNFTGQPLVRVPEYNVGIRGTYTRDLGPGEITLSGGYNYLDDFVFTTFAGQPDIEGGYGLFDASIDYEWSNYRLSVSGKNLTDEEYRNHSLPSVFFQGWGDPQTWAVELSARF
ncbi:MAG: TonB-dependent receptor [Hyphomonadaceae bacterium]|nr:TonB-dependent receptor [Hyphomonadaceae bacterium]